ncbi:MAG: DnaJ domain-containing protein [Verrucomicrobiota bacterium]|nr:DnaJ domain-containing protein [Verrucomicrobiota bacterium]
MTDFFALLDLPRRPWIDDEELKAKYHAKALQFHPDTSLDMDNGDAFAELNEAHQTLREPKRRLQHLLALERPAARPVATESIPSQIQQRFQRVSETTHLAGTAIEKARATRNALTRGLVEAEILRARSEVSQLLEELRQLHDEADVEVRALDLKWDRRTNNEVAETTRLQLIFTYLGRWIAQLEETQFQLSQS